MALRGSASTTKTCFGCLNRARLPARPATTPAMSWSSSIDVPDRGTTAATTASPKSGWGTPNTADSATPDSESIAASISFG